MNKKIELSNRQIENIEFAMECNPDITLNTIIEAGCWFCIFYHEMKLLNEKYKKNCKKYASIFHEFCIMFSIWFNIVENRIDKW